MPGLSPEMNSLPRRFHAVTGLAPEKAAYYFELHAHPWPSILAMLRECQIRNYSIAVKEIEGKFYLLSYFEYTGTDFAADMRKMAADPETRRWWRETAPCQLPLPEAAARNEVWSEAREVFYMP